MLRGFVIAFAFACSLAPIAARAASEQDRSFLTTALRESADLRTLSDLAAKKARDPRVRSFAKRIARTTADFGKTLLELAKREDLKPPATLSVRASDQYGRIEARSGKGAEQEFLADIAIDARVSGDDYSVEAHAGSEQALRRVAAARLAALGRTAREADALAASLR